MNTTDATLAAWCGGTTGVLLFNHLPTTAVAIAAAIAGITFLAVGRPPGARPLGALLLGLAYGTLAGREALSHRLPACGVGSTATFTGRLLAVSGDTRFARLDVAVIGSVRIAGGGCSPRVRRVRLAWRDADEPRSGQIWRFQARLKRPRGLQNAGGFDYEAWLLARRLDATGYVRHAHPVAAAGPLERGREGLRRRLRQAGLAHGDVLEALILGDASALRADRWDLLRRTGTVHLMVVSGLHIGLIAGFGFFIGRWLGSLSWLLRRWGARPGGTLFALGAATGYAALAGWSLPVQRAWLMAAALLLCVQLGREAPLRRALLMTLAIVLAADPLAGLRSGFWLSFGAVALLLAYFVPRAPLFGARRAPLFGARRAPLFRASRSRLRWAWRLVAAQLLLLVGMAPLLAQATSELPPLAPLANLVAVPLVTGWVVPGALAGGLLLGIDRDLGLALLGAVDATVGLLFQVLRALADLAQPVVVPAAAGSYPANMVAVGLGVLVVGGALLPQPAWRRLLLLAGLLLLRPAAPDSPRVGHFRVRVLDVGQGLAVLVQTARHALLYDAGARYPTGFDVGAAVVVPAVRAAGVGRLDALFISHADIDHRGGAPAVIAALEPRWSVGLANGDAPCRQGLRWQWDRVTFEVLHPARPLASRAGNEGSCVLRIAGTGAAALLPGDVERRAERDIAKAREVQAALLVAPHHGSRTSSSRSLLRHVRPEVVLISAGYRNRFGHPHPVVLQRYRSIGARWYLTATDGALTWESRAPTRLERRRARAAPYWRVQ